MFTKTGYALSSCLLFAVYMLGAWLTGTLPAASGAGNVILGAVVSLAAAGVVAVFMAEDSLMCYASSGRFFREFPQENWRQRVTLSVVAFFRILANSIPWLGQIIWLGLQVAAAMVIVLLLGAASTVLTGQAHSFWWHALSTLWLCVGGFGALVLAQVAGELEYGFIFDPYRLPFRRA